jgi:hypothetical protein
LLLVEAVEATTVAVVLVAIVLPLDSLLRFNPTQSLLVAVVLVGLVQVTRTKGAMEVIQYFPQSHLTVAVAVELIATMVETGEVVAVLG